jgi:uncharacterized repeat protein (TIGR01451 family)
MRWEKFFQAFVILVLLMVSLPNFAFGDPMLSFVSTASPIISGGPPWPKNCRLLDDPDVYLSGALESVLRIHCGRVDLEPFVGTTARPSVPAAPAALKATQHGDVQVNDSGADPLYRTTQSEASLALRSSDGRLCAAWNDSSVYPTDGSFNGFGYSDDGGATWHDQGYLPTQRTGYTRNWGDPDVKVDRWGVFYYSTLIGIGEKSGIGVARSYDGCESFSAPVTVHAGTRDDKELMAIDTYPGSPYVDNIYVAWTNFAAGHPYLSVSSDGGSTWSPALDLCPTCSTDSQHAPIPRVAPNGDVYVAWINFFGAGDHDCSLDIVRSTDGGISFGSPVRVVDFDRSYNPTATDRCGRLALNGDIRYTNFPSLDITPDGVLHIAYSADPDAAGSGDAADVYYVHSADEGAAWSPPLRLNDDDTTRDQFFPTIEASPNGVLTVYWYDRRADPANLEFEIYKAFSYDGGLIWSDNLLASDTPSPIPPINPNFDSIVRDCYMGDYNVADSDEDYVYLIWSDNRLIQDGHPDPDVWFEKEWLFESVESLSLISSHAVVESCPGSSWRHKLILVNNAGFDDTFAFNTVVSGPVEVLSIPPTVTLDSGEHEEIDAIFKSAQIALPNATSLVTVTVIAQSDPAYSDTIVIENLSGGPGSFKLAFQKGTEPSYALPGQPITYNLTFTNSGICTTTAVIITDVIPSSVVTTLVVNSGIVITDTHTNPPYTWNVQDLAPGMKGAITITGAISPNLVTDTIIFNDAIITANPAVTSTSISDQASINVAVPRIRFGDTTYSVAENDGLALITVTLEAPNPYAAVMADYITDDGSATSGSDYAVVSGTLTIPADSLSVTFSVPIINDWADESDETILLNLSNPRGGSLSGLVPVTLTIVDDDTAGIEVGPTSLTVSEPSGSGIFTFTLTSEPTAPVIIGLSISNSECGLSTSVVTLTGSNWGNGVGVIVTAVDDSIGDGDQTCVVQTAAASSGDDNYAGLNPPDVMVTVQDDDPPPIDTFTLGAWPTSLLANGVDTSTLTITTTDASGSGAPFAGQVVTLAWTTGFFPGPVMVTLVADGVATHTYTASTITGTAIVTATIDDQGFSKIATTTLQLNDNPLEGRLTFEVGALTITYTFVVSNTDLFNPHINLVMTGSVPVDAALIAVTGGISEPTGGDYGWGYVEASIAELPPGESYTLTWTVKPSSLVGSVDTQAHAISETAVRRLVLSKHIYRVSIIPIFRNVTRRLVYDNSCGIVYR